ncbi:MAG: hypothetical protein ACFFGZ_12600 [Candidatus Thorarchaeota archaeon]
MTLPSWDGGEAGVVATDGAVRTPSSVARVIEILTRAEVHAGQAKTALKPIPEAPAICRRGVQMKLLLQVRQ